MIVVRTNSFKTLVEKYFKIKIDRLFSYVYFDKNIILVSVESEFCTPTVYVYMTYIIISYLHSILMYVYILYVKMKMFVYATWAVGLLDLSK